MAPKKKEQQKMSLGDFLTDSGSGFGGGSWADEVEETYVTGTQPLPPSDRYRSGGGTSAWQDRGYSVRERSPQRLPDKPPFTAHLGNLSYDATSEAVSEFFDGCEVVSVRIIEDRELMRPKGFGYVEFTTLDGLKKALTLDGESFQSRMIKIKIADPPRSGDGRGESTRDLSDWSRKGPLPDVPSSRNNRPSDFGDRRPRDDGGEGPRAPERTWERRGPLSPIPGQESGPRDGGSRPAPQGMGERSESYRGSQRQASASWGEGRQEGSRPPRRDESERPDRPERTATAAEMDTQWRTKMRPDAAATAASPAQEGSAPSSPAPASAVPAQAPAPAGRPKLNLAKRTVSEAPDAASPTSGDAKASPFGAARPIDTATREKQVEERRQQAIVEKREADEKAKEDRRLAKEAAAKAEAEAKENSTEAAETEAAEEPKADGEAAEAPNDATSEQKVPIRSKEPREPKEPTSPKPRAFEASSWRTASSEQRGGARGGRGGRGGRGDRAERGDGAPRGGREGRPPRSNGSPAQAPGSPASGDGESPVVDADGWVTVPKKARGGRA